MTRRKRGRQAELRARISALVEAMETPLYRARGMADALAFVGYGLESLEYDGAQPVLTISTSLMDDIEVVYKNWIALTKAIDGG